MKKIITLLLITNSLFAQPPDIQFESIPIADGVGDATGVFDMLQDGNGFVWLATIDGLSRYDGYSFKTFLHNPFDSTTISGNRIFALCEANGYLWTGVQGQGLDRFDPATEEFKRYRYNSKDSTSISIPWIFDMVKESNFLWIATQGKGLYKFNLETEEFTHFKHDPNDSQSLSSNTINKLYIDKNENLWIGCGGITEGSDPGGLNRYDPETNTFKHYIHLEGNDASLLSDKVWGISEDNSGVLYVGTDHSMLHSYDQVNDQFVRLPANASNGPFASIGEGWNMFRPVVSSIHDDTNGYLWIGTLSGGINRFNYKTGDTQHYSFNANESYGLKSNNIFDIFEDKQGTIWIPMLISGLTKVIPSRDRFHPFANDSKYSDLLGKLYVYALFQDSRGKIWIGTNDGEVFCYDPVKDFLKDYTQTIPDNVREVNVFFEDSRGSIWMGFRGAGGLPWILKSGSNRFEKFIPKKDNQIPWSSVLNIFEDDQGDLWFGMENNGINQINPNNNSVKQYTRNWDNPEPGSLSHTKVYSSLYDSHGNYWFGSYNGLNLLNKETDNFDVFLEEESIWALCEDSNGRFWVGTRFHGLILFDRAAKKTMERFTTAEGLSSNAVYSIVEDSLGYIWIMTPPGLTRLDAESLTFTSYNQSDGITNYFTDDPDAAIRLKNRELLFGGIKGITGVYPDNFSKNEIPPQIAVTKLYVFEKLFNERGALPVDVVLDYNQNDLTFEYVGLHFKEPSKNKYKIKLEPYEKEWSKPSKSRTARYTSLSSGTYTFHVKASNSDGIWNEQGKKLTIIINPPLWATWWAYTFYILFVIGLLYSVRKFELNRQRKNAEIKESKLKTKAAEEQYKEAKIETALEKVRSKAMSMNNSEDLALTVDVFFKELKGLMETPRRCGVTLINEESRVANLTVTSATDQGEEQKMAGKLKLAGHPVLDKVYEGWKQQKEYHPVLVGDEIKKYYQVMNPQIHYPDFAADETQHGYYFFFKEGGVFAWTENELSENDLKIFRRYTSVLSLTYRRYIDLKKAEAQNKIIQAENDRKTQELEEARRLQLAMLPKELPQISNLDIAVYMQTATEVGGDYYDFSISEDGTLNVAVGDATGHGMQAGTVVTLIKSLFTSEASKKDLLNFLKDSSKVIKGMDLGRLMMAFSMLKIKGKELQFSNAGMPPLYIFKKESRYLEEVELQGMPLGAMNNFEYKLYETEINSGDCLFLLSDGMPELQNENNEMYGYERLKTVFESHAEKTANDLITLLKGEGSNWVNNQDPDDDVTFVVIKVK